MKSISTSDQNILELDQLRLRFQLDLYRNWTWRDAFVGSSSRAKESGHEAQIVNAVKNVSLTLKRGDRLAIMGRNGSGKTTLCRCIAGFYRPQAGTVKVRGSVRAVFDTGVGIQPELTGKENALLLARFMYPGDPDIRELVDEAIGFSELGRFADAPYRVYSMGMQARLYLSLVSAKPSDLFIFDEVFDGADQFFRAKIADRMLKVIDESGAVIFVSHAPDQVRKICNRAIVMNRGEVVFEGGVEEGLGFYSTS